MNCQERAGFLFSHDCDQPGLSSCGTCGKLICIAHQRFDAGRLLCISCLSTAGAAADPQEKTSPTDRSDDPYFYSQHHAPGYRNWDDRDYAAFESKSSPSTASDADDFESNVDGT